MTIHFLLLFWDLCIAELSMVLLNGSDISYKTGWVPFIPCLAIIFLFYLSLKFFLRKERAVNTVIVFSAINAILSVGVIYFLFITTQPLRDLFIFFICFSYIVGRAIQYNIHPPAADNLSGRFEGSLFMLAAALLIDAGWSMEHTWVIPYFILTLMLLFALAAYYTLGPEILAEHPVKVFSALGICTGLISAACFIALSITAVPFENGIKAGALLLYELSAKIASVFAAIMIFLFSLLPDGDGGELVPAPYQEMSLPATPEDMPALDPQWIYALVVIGIIAILGMLFWKLRGHKLKLSQKKLSINTLSRQRGSVFSFIRHRLSMMLRNAKIHLKLIQSRNTCYGCYYWLQAKNSHSVFCCKQGETPMEYLKRLSLSAPEMEPEFLSLSQSLYEYLYGCEDRDRQNAYYDCRPIKSGWNRVLRNRTALKNYQT